MSKVSMDLVKELREKTQVSMMDCKKALEEAGGDIEKAKVILRKISATAASKKADRELGAGIVASYTHAGGAVASMVVVASMKMASTANPNSRRVNRGNAVALGADNVSGNRRRIIRPTGRICATISLGMLSVMSAAGRPSRSSRRICPSGMARIDSGHGRSFWMARAMCSARACSSWERRPWKASVTANSICRSWAMAMSTLAAFSAEAACCRV